MSVWSGQDVSFLFFVCADFLLFVLLLWAASIVEPMAFLVACHLTNKYACLLACYCYVLCLSLLVSARPVSDS